MSMMFSLERVLKSSLKAMGSTRGKELAGGMDSV